MTVQNGENDSWWLLSVKYHLLSLVLFFLKISLVSNLRLFRTHCVRQHFPLNGGTTCVACVSYVLLTSRPSSVHDLFFKFFKIFIIIGGLPLKGLMQRV